MGRFDFCKGFYKSTSPLASNQLCVNFYPEQDESGAGKSQWQLYKTPGLGIFAQDGNAKSIRGSKEFNGRAFFIADGRLWEVFADKSKVSRGTIATDTNPASIAAGIGFLAIASAGNGYAFNLATNVLSQIDTTTGAALQGSVSQMEYSDGFFIALLSSTNKWQTSALLDPTTWNPLNIAEVSVFGENIVALIVEHREVAIFGNKRSVAYFDSGNVFPFDVVPGGYLEQGCAAQFSVTRLDNAIFWLGQDERGAAVAWRLQGYNPLRISNHAIEQTWQQYKRIDDAIAYAFQFNGHLFWQINFPTAGHSWRYDVATQMWHEVQSTLNQVPGMHFSQNHMFAFGKHLVGDWNSGTLYEMSSAFYDDAGNPMICVRQAPVIALEQERIAHNRFVLDAETGLGPQPPLKDGNGNPRGPQAMLKISDDGGQSFHDSEYIIDLRQAGNREPAQPIYRLGVARNRVYKLTFSDPTALHIIDAYFNQPQDRLANRFRQMA